MPGRQQTPCFIGPQAKWTSRRSEVTGCVTKRHCSETPLCCPLPLVTLGSFSYGVKKGTVLKFFLSVSSESPPTWPVMVTVAHVHHPHSQHGPRYLRRSGVLWSSDIWPAALSAAHSTWGLQDFSTIPFAHDYPVWHHPPPFTKGKHLPHLSKVLNSVA